MQVELSVVLGLASSVAAALVGAYVAIARLALKAHSAEVDRRIAAAQDAATTATATCERLQRELADERIRATRLEGDLALVRQGNAGIAADVHEIKGSMLRREEWHTVEPMLRSLQQLLVELRAQRQGPGRYTSVGAMAAQRGGGTSMIPPRPAPRDRDR